MGQQYVKLPVRALILLLDHIADDGLPLRSGLFTRPRNQLQGGSLYDIDVIGYTDENYLTSG